MLDALKYFLLRAWARGTHIVAHEAGLLIVLYLLNLAPIAWLNVHTYGGGQLDVLAVDAVFLLGGVLLYILLLGFIPLRRLRRLLFAASFFSRCCSAGWSSSLSCSTARSSARVS